MNPVAPLFVLLCLAPALGFAETPAKPQGEAPAQAQAQPKAPAKAKTPAPAAPQVAAKASIDSGALAPPEIAAKGYVLIAHPSGQVLAESNGDQRLEPASLTKTLSAYAVFHELAAGHVALTDEVLISEKAWRTGGSRMFIDVGKKVGLEELVKGMVIQSGNDASVALAEHIASSEEGFAKLMNVHAQRLGMTNSHFANATGLPDPNEYTTAKDLAKVATATIREFPEYYKWYGVKEYLFNNIKQHNRNLLLWRDDSVDGMKTGHTEGAGYCLMASAQRDGMRLTSVVMGAASQEARTAASLALLNYGFRAFESHRLYEPQSQIESLRIWMGEVTQLPVGPAEEVSATIPRGRYNQLSAHIQKHPDIVAPIAKGQQVGDIVLSLGDKEIGRQPLVALRDVAEGGLWARIRDTVLRWFS
jgi:D-alanyl-D-alanine carboxypeptidase (penicillin-binding protein 5/6)